MTTIISSKKSMNKLLHELANRVKNYDLKISQIHDLTPSMIKSGKNEKCKIIELVNSFSHNKNDKRNSQLNPALTSKIIVYEEHKKRKLSIFQTTNLLSLYLLSNNMHTFAKDIESRLEKLIDEVK